MTIRAKSQDSRIEMCGPGCATWRNLPRGDTLTTHLEPASDPTLQTSVTDGNHSGLQGGCFFTFHPHMVASGEFLACSRMFFFMPMRRNGIQAYRDLSTTPICTLNSQNSSRTSHLTVALLILRVLRDGATCVIWVWNRVLRVSGEGSHIFLHNQTPL